MIAKIDKYDSKESAGEILAEQMEGMKFESPYVLAILRGGIQVAKGIADKLKVPVNPLIVKKLPSPGNPEYGFGAVTEDGTKVLNEEAISYLRISEDTIKRIAERVVKEIQNRKELYGGLEDEKIGKSDVIIVDDGIATGYSLIAGIKTIQKRAPRSITVAVPVSSEESFDKIKNMVDNIVCPLVSNDYFFAVASYYDEWRDLSENEIKKVLEEYRNKYSTYSE